MITAHLLLLRIASVIGVAVALALAGTGTVTVTVAVAERANVWKSGWISIAWNERLLFDRRYYYDVISGLWYRYYV